jgi:glycosyltransferase involved in cell wall biosynthesis
MPSPWLIDVTRLTGRLARGRLPTGVDRVCLAYVRRYGAESRAVLQRGRHFHALSAPASRDLFGRLLGEAPMTWAAVARRALGSLFGGSETPARGSLLLNVGHSGVERPGFAAAIAEAGLRPVFMVHDLIPIESPEYCRPGEDVRHAHRMAVMLQSGVGLIANSAATLASLRGFAGRAGHAVPPCVVAHLGVEPHLSVASVPPRADPYFLMLGTIEPRKNHLLVLNVWSRLVERLGDAAPTLVLVGQRGWECENVADLLDRSPRLAGAVVELSRCSDRELAGWLAGARALLFPSHAEGFGLPMVEALASGTPVLASDLAVFREVAGDVPDYLDPIDGPGWLAAVCDYVPDDSRRRVAQLGRIGRFSPPDWPGHFSVVDRFLAGLA